MSVDSDQHNETAAILPTAPRFTAWPLWATAAGALGLFSTVFMDPRPSQDIDYTVTVKDMPGLDYLPFRIGGFTGYLCVAALIVFAAIWQRRVAQRWSWSVGAAVVTYGLVSSSAALMLTYGWKGALGDYLHGAAESGAYDDQGLYSLYMVHDFGPYIAWVGVLVAAGGLAWMAFRDGIVSKILGGFAALLCVALVAAVLITGVPGLPAASMLGLIGGGLWLAFGKSEITQGV
jgi:hypothetical protein